MLSIYNALSHINGVFNSFNLLFHSLYDDLIHERLLYREV